jgi:hypothetical protein
MSMYIRDIDLDSVSTIFRLDFANVLMVSDFSHVIIKYKRLSSPRISNLILGQRTDKY